MQLFSRSSQFSQVSDMPNFYDECDCDSNYQPHNCLPNRLFGQIKEHIEAPRYWPLWGEFTGDRWIPRTKGQWRGKFSIWWRHHESLAYLRHVCTWDRGTAKYFRDLRNIPRMLKRIPAGLPKRPVLPVVSQNLFHWRRFLSPRMRLAGQFQFRVRSGTRQDWKWK